MSVSRRLMLGGLGAAIATPAAAQFSVDLGSLGRTARAVSINEKDEIAMGAQLYGASIDAMGGAYANRAVQAAVMRVADPILRTSARTAFAWEVTVVDANEVNAWALPGGKIAINKGLLRYVDNEDELAAVIAHEMGHAELAHAAKELRSKALRGFASAAASAAATASSDRDNRVAVGGASLGASAGILQLVASGYSRQHEREADNHIAAVFAKTGHSVTRGAGFYRTLLELVPAGAKGTTSLFAGHPQTRERFAALMAMPSPATAARPSPAFGEVKAVFPTRKVYLRGRLPPP